MFSDPSVPDKRGFRRTGTAYPQKQHQQHRGKKNGVTVAKAPDEGLHHLHGRIMIYRKANGLIGQKETHNKREGKGDQNPGISPPQAEVVSGNE